MACAKLPSHNRAGSTDRQNLDPVPARSNEFQQVARCNPRSRGVFQWVEIDDLKLHHGLIQYHIDTAFGIIEQRKGRHRARSNAEHLFEQFGLAEGQARRTDHSRQFF